MFLLQKGGGSSGGSGSGSGDSGSGSGSGNGSTPGPHDEVDFSQCFEDTAILYGVCLVVWVLGGLQFIFASYHRRKIPINLPHIAKLVS